jgi:diacylglycerol kinase (ATP)
MRAAAILGLGCSPKNLTPFQAASTKVEWLMGIPADSDQSDVIVLFGGDGTMHRHLNQLVELRLPVLVVPAGSGNDFARSLGLQSVRDSVAAWQEFCNGSANIRSIDLGTIQADGVIQYFCCIAGVGLDAEVSRRANHLPRWLRGHGGYALTLLPTIFSFAAVRTKILMLDDKQSPSNAPSWITLSDQPTFLAAFANTPTFGGGMKIAPRAKMDDGLLDVCVLSSLNPFKLFYMFPTVYFGKHLQVREVEYFQAAHLRLETEIPLDVYADGEFVCQTPVEISLSPAALKLITGN